MHPSLRRVRRRLLRWPTPILAALALTLVPAGPGFSATSDDRPAAAEAADSRAAAEVHGLKGEYYTHSAPGAFDFDQLKATAFDPSLDFDNLEPRLAARAGQADNVSVRWTGGITPEVSGAHTFHVSADNGFRLWVDGEVVIDHWIDDWDKEQTSQPVTLEAGRTYDIKVEYFEHHGGSNFHLRWTKPGAQKEAVPQSAFSLPADFDYSGPTDVAVQPDGRTLTMDFAQPLAAPPATFDEHLEAVIGGADWPRAAAELDPEDPTRLIVPLDEPVVGQGGSADVRYDGEGGLTGADGSDIGEFWTSGANDSEYQLRTKWADDVDEDAPLPEYPRPQLTREDWQSLNGTWQFAGATEGESPPFGRTLDEKIVVPYPVESELSGVQRYEERMWYKRTFTVPRDWRVGQRGERLQLNFDAVDWKADVWLNGKQVASHKGGYDRFSADVTQALRGSGKQELIVGVYDPTDSAAGENPPMGKQRLSPSGIWYTSSSGIWQSVWMEPVPTDRAEDLKITADVAGEQAAVEVQGVRDGVPVTATAYDGRREVGTATGRTGEPLTVPVPDPKLWSPDNPHLYDLKVTVGRGTAADQVRGYFGMRTVGVETIDGQRRMTLNGEPVFAMATLDQGFWPEGIHTAPTDKALKYDLEMHKEMGFNSVRKHIKVEPDRWFYHADKLGLLVWQDMPSMNTKTPSQSSRTQFEHELKEMIEQHDSHPSVVMWVTFNEGWGQYDQARIADYAKELDPTRLVNNMSGHNCCGAVDGGNGDISDAHGYPSAQLPKPDGTRALVSGEYGGLGLAIPGNAWPVRHTYVGVDREAYTEEYLTKLAEVERFAACNGSSGAVYTQITDVEGELNGLLTYDRKVLKPDVERIRAAHEALIEGAADGTLTCDAS